MSHAESTLPLRAERRAAIGQRPTYASDEGLS